MIDYDTFYRIQNLKREGLNISQISTKLNYDQKTISKWFK